MSFTAISGDTSILEPAASPNPPPTPSLPSPSFLNALDPDVGSILPLATTLPTSLHPSCPLPAYPPALDVVQFTTIAAATSPIVIVDMLNTLFRKFDEAITDHPHLYALDKIGDW